MRLAVAFLCLAIPAQAGTPCLPDFDQFAKALHDRFGEVPQVGGVMGGGRPLVIFSNPATGTWTVVIQAADGSFCSPASGEGFKAVPPGQPT